MSLDEFSEVFFPMLLSGLKLTLVISICGIFAGFILGLCMGTVRHYKIQPFYWFSSIYINVFRAIPLLVQALYFYYVLPQLLGVDFDGVSIGIVVIALNSGSFFTEITRGALDTVDEGVQEAGEALALTKLQIFSRLVFPMAFRYMVPSICNQFIISIKETSILTIIAVNEMTQMTRNYIAMSYHTIEAYTILAAAYLVILSIINLLQLFLQNRLARYEAGRA